MPYRIPLLSLFWKERECSPCAPPRVLTALAAATAAFFLATPAHAVVWSTTNNGTVTFNAGDVLPSSGTWTGFKYLNYGTINVQGNALIGSTTATIPFYFDTFSPTYNTLAVGGDSVIGEGTTTNTGKVLNIGDATHNATLTVAECHPYVRVYKNNTMTIAAGSALAMIPNVVGSTAFTHHSELANYEGTINLAGKIQFAHSHTASYNRTTITNYGNFNIIGNTVFERVANTTGQYANDSNHVVNNASGKFSGQGTFTYTNSTGAANLNTASLLNYGVISPGTAAATGTLNLENFNLSNGSFGKFAFRLGGTDAGEFDQLNLLGLGANFSLASQATLNLTTINGFTPQPGDSWTIITFGSRTSSPFQTFTVNGLAPTGYNLLLNTDNITVVFIPEPASLTLLATGTLLLLARRRR